MLTKLFSAVNNNNNNVLYSSQRESKSAVWSFTLTHNEELNCIYLNNSMSRNTHTYTLLDIYPPVSQSEYAKEGVRSVSLRVPLTSSNVWLWIVYTYLLLPVIHCLTVHTTTVNLLVLLNNTMTWVQNRSFNFTMKCEENRNFKLC